MKNLLRILSVLNITIYTSASAVACGPNFNFEDDDDSDQELVTLKNNFIADVGSIIQNYFTSPTVTSRLIQTTETFKDNAFLNIKAISDQFNSSFTNSYDETREFSLKNISKELEIRNDLNKAMQIDSILSILIEEQMQERSEYSFLLTNLDNNIFKNFNLYDTIKIRRQKHLESLRNEEFIYSISFDISVEINFRWNGVLESHEFSPISTKVLLIENEAIYNSIIEILNSLAKNLYQNDILKFNEHDLDVEDSRFIKQAEMVANYFGDEQNLEKLKNESQLIINDIKFIDSISFDEISSSTFSNLYANNRFDLYPSFRRGDFIDRFLLMNDGDTIAPDTVEKIFAQQFGGFTPYDKRLFLNKAKTIINESFEIELESSDFFIEYGTLILDKVSINAFEIDFDMPPIGLLYTYNSQKQYSEALRELLSNWQKEFGISKPSNQKTLFKFSDKTEVGKKFWDNIEANQNLSSANPNFFSSINKVEFTSSLEGTGFSSFRISESSKLYDPTTFSAKNSASGLSLNFGSFNNASSQSKAGAYTFKIEIEGIHIFINFGNIEHFRDTFWNNEDHKIMFIER